MTLEMHAARIINLSAEYQQKLYAWLPGGLQADTVVFFPDACPGKSPMPTGTATRLLQADWRRYAVSDCGCGMRLLSTDQPTARLSEQTWNAVADRLRRNKGQLGDLGGGNHFTDALEPYGEDRLHFLIHTGSRDESGLVDALIDQPAEFDREFTRIVQWARDNRAAVQQAIESVFGKCEVLLDLPHNTFELQADGSVIIRKGAVKATPGCLNVVPSHMSGDVALVRATDKVSEVLYSLNHGTGRTMARSGAKQFAGQYDFAALRQRVLMPAGLDDSSLRTEGPYAYRELDVCLALLDGYVELVDRFAVIGYLGHLG